MSIKKLTVLPLLPLVCLFMSAAPHGFAAEKRSGPVITVSAATSLTDVFKEIAGAYQRRHPSVKVDLNFGASGTLSTQIEQGAPVDVFASADARHIDQLITKGLVTKNSRTIFAYNKLIIAVQSNSKIRLRNLSDLKSSGIQHIGIGDPAYVPNGTYAQQALKKANVWDAIRDKLVMGSDVRQVRTYALRGEVDAAFMFATDTRINELRVAYVVPYNMHDKIVYCTGTVKNTKNIHAATDFVSFLKSTDARKILNKYGFTTKGK